MQEVPESTRSSTEVDAVRAAAAAMTGCVTAERGK